MTNDKTENRIVGELYHFIEGQGWVREWDFPHVKFVNAPRDGKILYTLSIRYPHPLPPPKFEVFEKLHDLMTSAWRGDKKALAKLPPITEAEFRPKGRELAIIPKSFSARVLIQFFRDFLAGKTAICANPNCPTPYFIRQRKSQKYCEQGPCVEQAQREQKRLWWAKNRGKGARK